MYQAVHVYMLDAQQTLTVTSMVIIIISTIISITIFKLCLYHLSSLQNFGLLLYCSVTNIVMYYLFNQFVSFLTTVTEFLYLLHDWNIGIGNVLICYCCHNKLS